MSASRIILASSSPYRRELLQRLGVPFDTASPACDETAAPDETPAGLVERLAHAKAERIATTTVDDAIVIGSDQVAAVGNTVLTKPGTHERAVEQLRSCSGRAVVFYTGLCVINTRSSATYTERVEYRIDFRSLQDDEIERYLRWETPYDCAGSIRSEGYAITLFERMVGDDPTALVGLPLIRLTELLRYCGIALP